MNAATRCDRHDTSPQLLDLESIPARSFALADEREPFQTELHAHSRNQLLYAVSGTLHLEVGDAHWFLPPRRAAWIGAGVEHRVRTQQEVSLRTIYLDAAIDPLPGVSCRVFPVVALAREMILFAMRWTPERRPDDAVADSFFQTLGGLCAIWAAQPTLFCLPVAQSPELERAMRYALDHLTESPTLHEAARAAFVSPRTLNRRFQAETGSTWREFIHAARMIQAMERLADGDPNVTEVAAEVGFDSPGAFTKAFRAYTGELPSQFRRRRQSGGERRH